VIQVNGENDACLNESVADLLARRGIEPRGIAVAVNGDVVRHGEWSTTLVHDDSKVEIVTAVAGG
jgi:sulfur carrier protein